MLLVAVVVTDAARACWRALAARRAPRTPLEVRA
jgi:hypothetical protein